MSEHANQPSKNPPRLTGKRLGPKAVVAAALLEQQVSHRTVKKLTGISLNSSVALKRQGLEKLISPEHAEQIRRGLRNKFAIVSDTILGSVEAADIKEASLGEKLRAAGIAADRAGIGPVSHVETYITKLIKYEKPPQPGVVNDPPPAEKAEEP